MDFTVYNMELDGAGRLNIKWLGTDIVKCLLMWQEHYKMNFKRPWNSGCESQDWQAGDNAEYHQLHSDSVWKGGWGVCFSCHRNNNFDHNLYSAAGNRYRTGSDHGLTPHTPKEMMEYQTEWALSGLLTIPVQSTLKLKSRAKVGKW